jgi:hypothetical protein
MVEALQDTITKNTKAKGEASRRFIKAAASCSQGLVHLWLARWVLNTCAGVGC